MLRALLLSLSLASCAVLIACNDAGEDLPSSLSEVTTSGADDCPTEIAELIDDLFKGGLKNAAYTQCGNTKRQLDRGETADAIGKALDLIGFILDHYAGGRLQDPNGSAPPTTEEAVAELINLLLALVGLDPIFPADGLGDPDFAAEICEAGEECEVVTDTKFAGLRATFAQTVLVVISRLPDDPGPFEEFGFDDFPLFYDISATGGANGGGGSFGLALAQDVPITDGVAGVCVVDPPDPFAPDPEIAGDLRLAHVIEVEGEPEVEILPLADADFLDCTGAATEPVIEITLLERWQRRATTALEPVSDFLVAPLFANPARLGGAIAALSPFGAVDPGSVDGEPETTPTTTTLEVDDSSLIDGQTTTATATVNPSPTGGDVRFVVDGNTVNEQTTDKTVDDGEASVDILCDATGEFSSEFIDFEIGSGTHTLQAFYLGDGTFEPSQSSQVLITCLAD